MQAVFETVRPPSYPLLKVAATQAKRMLYVVGNVAERQSPGVFAVAAAERDNLDRMPLAR